MEESLRLQLAEARSENDEEVQVGSMKCSLIMFLRLHPSRTEP